MIKRRINNLSWLYNSLQIMCPSFWKSPKSSSLQNTDYFSGIRFAIIGLAFSVSYSHFLSLLFVMWILYFLTNKRLVLNPTSINGTDSSPFLQFIEIGLEIIGFLILHFMRIKIVMLVAKYSYHYNTFIFQVFGYLLSPETFSPTW